MALASGDESCRMRSSVSDDAIAVAIDQSCPQFDIESVKPEQRLALSQLVRGDDVLACFPTGFGKSLIFHLLPSVCNVLRTMGYSKTFPIDPIVLVAAPLLSLMRDQVAYLTECGVRASMIGTSESTDKEIKAGKFNIVFGSPEVLVGQKKWRLELQEGVFRDRVVAIVADEVHTVVQWGGLAVAHLEEEDDEPFRVWCGLVGELRSVVSAPMLALTATASKATREIIVSCLGMSGRCYVIAKSPERDNIFLAVKKVHSDVEATFDFLLRLVKSKQINCPRVLVYCQMQSVCSLLFTHFHYELGDKAYWPEGEKRAQNRVVEMYHACTPDSNKQLILQSLRDANGVCRVVFSTNALGMGIDVKGLTTVIHYGPSADLEAYMQEIGRAGRDGSQSYAYLLYHGHQLRHTKKEMREYVNNTAQCRRAMLLAVFDAVPNRSNPSHTCCDICSAQCQCQSPDQCPGLQSILIEETSVATSSPGIIRHLQTEQRELLEFLLLEYKLEVETKLGIVDQPLYTHPTLVTGLSDHVLQSVLENAGQLFTVQDIQALTPVFSIEHAQKILTIITEVCGQF